MPKYLGQKVHYRRKGMLRLRLRDLLKARGMTAYGLARFTGLSLNTLYRLTRPNGRFEVIRADTIERLCAALRITPNELFAYTKPIARRADAQEEKSDAPGIVPGAP
jgi:DNA-binding Xre family transcriptional regulator